MSKSSVKLSTLAKQNSPEYQFLREADVTGDQNGAVSPDELCQKELSTEGTKLSGAKLAALKTSFLNTLDPNANSCVATKNYAGGVVLPKDFVVNEHIKTGLLGRSIFSSFDVEDNGKTVAVIERQYRAQPKDTWKDQARNLIAPTLIMRNPAIKDKDQNVVARASSKALDIDNAANALRSTIVIEDAEGKVIGTLREKWWSAAGSAAQWFLLGAIYYSNYEILDPNGNVIAESEKRPMYPSLVIKKDGEYLNEGSRPAWNFSFMGEKWELKTNKPNVVDRRIWAFVAAYRTQTNKMTTDLNWIWKKFKLPSITIPSPIPMPSIGDILH